MARSERRMPTTKGVPSQCCGVTDQPIYRDTHKKESNVCAEVFFFVVYRAIIELRAHPCSLTRCLSVMPTGGWHGGQLYDRGATII